MELKGTVELGSVTASDLFNDVHIHGSINNIKILTSLNSYSKDIFLNNPLSSLPSLFLSRRWWWRCSHDQRFLRWRSHGHRVARRPIHYLFLSSLLPLSSSAPTPLLTPHHSPSVARYDGVKRQQADTWPPARICRRETTLMSRKHEEKWKREKEIFFKYINALFLDAQ